MSERWSATRRHVPASVGGRTHSLVGSSDSRAVPVPCVRGTALAESVVAQPPRSSLRQTTAVFGSPELAGSVLTTVNPLRA